MVFVELPNKVVRFVLRFFEKIGLETRFNAVHGVKRVVQQVLHAALGRYSVESGYQLLSVQLSSNEVASADVVLGHLHGLSRQKMQVQMDKSIREARDFAKQRYQNPVMVAVDYHEQPYYGDHSDPHVVGTKRRAGTNWAWRYITAEIVEDGKRLCIASEPVYSDDEKPVVLARVLEQVKKIVKISWLLIDRGFYDVKCIIALKKSRARFILPVVKDKKMKRLMNENANKLPFVGTHTLGGKNGETFTLGLKREGEEVHGFATNEPFSGCTPIETESFVKNISDTYSCRWGIETGYRVKNNFLAKTTTRDPKIRQLYFFLSVVLYNAWILTNQLLEKHITVFLFNHLLTHELILAPRLDKTLPP